MMAEIMLDGIPGVVFSHYKELEEAELAVPEVTYLMHDLKERIGYHRCALWKRLGRDLHFLKKQTGVEIMIRDITIGQYYPADS